MKTNKQKSTTFVVLVVFVLTGFIAVLNAQNKIGGLLPKSKKPQKVVLTADLVDRKDSFRSSEQVLLDLEIRNGTSIDLYLVDSSTPRDYKFTVKTEQGRDVSLTAKGKQLTDPNAPVYRIRKVILKPGKSLKSNIDIAAMYDMSATGKYSIVVTRKGRKDRGELIQLKSEPIQVTIK